MELKKNMRRSTQLYILFLCFFISVPAQSLQELKKLKADYEKLEKSQALNALVNEDIKDINQNTDLPQSSLMTKYSLKSSLYDSIPDLRNHFGYDFFTKRDTIRFWESLPVPYDYVLGPGDEIIISLWGETQLRQTYTISREGKIYDEKVGLLLLVGKTIEDAKIYLMNQYGSVYSTLKGTNPSTFIDISIGQLRSINVNFVGEVFYPGVYPVHPFSTLITGLIQAGGVDTTGSLRNIEIKRDGKTHVKIDLYDYLLSGDLPKNIQLRDQDIVIVPIKSFTVTVDSAVVRPAIYEAVNGETMDQIIEYSGGLKPNASKLIGLKRIIPLKDRNNKTPNYYKNYIEFKDLQGTEVVAGDEITAIYMHEAVNQVEIIGQVKKPGTYYYYRGMTLRDLIYLGGGLNDETYRKSIYLNSAEIIRRDPESPYEKVITVNLDNVLNNSVNIELQNLDRFVVHANPNFVEKENIKIIGEVNIPGSYPLISNGETLKSIIDRSGGFTNKALKDGISIYRTKKFFEEESPDDNEKDFQYILSSANNELLQIPEQAKNDKDERVRVAWQNYNIRLVRGDSIVVREATGAVYVTGEVYNPGLIEFEEKKSLKHYINSAGGATLNGDKDDVIVVYANGVVVHNKLFSTPRIMDGATIIVNEKELKQPFDVTTFASSLLSIISTTVTILVLSKQLESG